MRISYSVFLAWCCLAFASSAQARPISYPDGWMAMTMNDYRSNSASVSYSPTARDAFGVRSDYMREDRDWVHTATYNRLLKRWNTPDSQANIYALTGLGVASREEQTAFAATMGMEADWETRRLYASYENRYIAAGDVEQALMQKARVGVAPYIGGYDDVHSWLMLQVEHNSSDRDQLVLTPMVRVFNQQLLGEVGISDTGRVMANVTAQF